MAMGIFALHPCVRGLLRPLGSAFPSAPQLREIQTKARSSNEKQSDLCTERGLRTVVAGKDWILLINTRSRTTKTSIKFSREEGAKGDEWIFHLLQVCFQKEETVFGLVFFFC